MRAIWIAVSMLGCGPVAAAAPVDGARFGQVCSGIETVQYGRQAPQRAIYTIALSINLDAKRYCYATCSRGQSYPIAAPAASPLVLADLDTPEQARHLVLDRKAARLSDDQRMVMGPVVVVRHATATCTAGPFREPPAP
ncbi:hypothetical protein QH494_14310 [Sphingomonas sp. AR_OL41]|uniref:hypothetical protein n=1 Tax=Sphingomonas sp. AR_OL41 TaxID=3042729 RepID=UPI00248133CB|nr:hypothetical protein [Sphingomonas sp. AR_OL41]MDH7973359.1 hypothetical protein [Sphingomonas sp. AR_OL41]